MSDLRSPAIGKRIREAGWHCRQDVLTTVSMFRVPSSRHPFVFLSFSFTSNLSEAG